MYMATERIIHMLLALKKQVAKQFINHYYGDKKRSIGVYHR
jgi:hypothetical protein